MKIIKLISILITLIFITGCYNYTEINDLTLIGAMSIDYNGGKYSIGLESLVQDKKASDSTIEFGNVKVGDGKSLNDAFNNALGQLEKKAYFYHIKVLIISEEIAQNHLSKIFDYLLRSYELNNDLTVLVSDEINPDKILLNTNEFNPVASDAIISLMKNNNSIKYFYENYDLMTIVDNYLNNYKDNIIPMISLDGKNFIINKFLTFSKNKTSGYLNINEINTLNFLLNKNPKTTVQYKCSKNGFITIEVNKNKSNILIYKDFIKISNDISASLIENNCNINLDEKDKNNNVSKKFETLIENDINNLLAKLKESNTDLIGLNKKYYNKFRSINNDYFKYSNFKIENKVNINKRGQIFEVKNNDY